MRPTTLQHLLNTKHVTMIDYGIQIKNQTKWVVSGESHLSYTTLTRLVECCREYHWQTDIAPYLASSSIDSICKSISAKFLRPVLVSSTVKIIYKVKQVRNRSYELLFKICGVDLQNIYALFNIVLVFYNTETDQTAAIPESAKNNLTKLGHLATGEQSGEIHE